MAGLVVRLLGPFEVSRDGEPVRGFRSDKVRALLAYLCLEPGGPHRREKLAGLLWPDLPEDSARTYLRHALSNLRRVLGDAQLSTAWLTVTPQTIQIAPSGDVWCDATALSDLAKGGRLRQLEQAVALYRGELLEGFSLPDGPLFEEWALLERERLHRLAVDALGRLAEAYERSGEPERALRYAWRTVELEPWREATHRQVMRLLAGSNRRLAALAQFETCRRLLAGELGVAPEAETEALYAQIRDGASPDGAQGPAPPHAGSPLRVHNVPVPLTPLLGRKAELAAIERSLGDPACRLVTLTGPGGIGKTHLALEAARGQAGWFADGVYLVGPATSGLPGSLVAAIAQAAGLEFDEAREPRRQLIDYLRGQEILLVVDCLDDLETGPTTCPEGQRWESAELVAELLRSAPGLKILAASRTPLGLVAEQVLPLAGLGDSESAELFVLAARRARPGFQPAAEETDDLARIGRMVGGLPLAILMAAAWVGTLTPAEILAELSRGGIDLLAAGWHDLPKRQRSLRAVLDHSWSLLSEREQSLLQRLSVFRGGWSRQAAQAVAGATLAEVRALADRSLLSYTSAQRYEIHEMVRRYAAERPESAGEAGEEGQARHSAFFAGWLSRAQEELHGPRQQAVLAEMEVEGENLVAAWNWAVARRQVDLLAAALDGLCSYFWAHGRSEAGEAALQAAAAGLSGEVEGGSPAALRLVALALGWRANFCRLLGRSEQAEALLQQSDLLLGRLEAAGQEAPAERAHIWLVRGHVAFRSDYGLARSSYGQSLELYRALGDAWGVGLALSGLGRVALFSGEIGRAGQYLEECLAIRQGLGDPRGTVGCLADLAEVEMLGGRFVQAERLAQECSSKSQRLGGRAEAAYGLLVWGETLEAAGCFEEARRRLQESLALYEELRRDHYVSYALAVLGTVELHLGRTEEARGHAQQGLALARQAGLAYRVGANLLALGGAALAEGAFGEAQALLNECADGYGQIGQRADRGWALALSGYAALGLGAPDKAEVVLREALDLAADTGSVLPGLWALPAIALMVAEGGETRQAVELYALASCYPLVGGSRWFAAVAGDRIAGLAAGLGPSDSAAAQAAGRGRRLEATVEGLRAWAQGAWTASGASGHERLGVGP